MDTQNGSIQMTDEQMLNRVVPRWARVLNTVYNYTFAPLDRLVDWVSGIGTRNMIAEFEAAEKRAEAKAKAAQS